MQPRGSEPPFACSLASLFIVLCHLSALTAIPVALPRWPRDESTVARVSPLADGRASVRSLPVVVRSTPVRTDVRSPTEEVAHAQYLRPPLKGGATLELMATLSAPIEGAEWGGMEALQDGGAATALARAFSLEPAAVRLCGVVGGSATVRFSVHVPAGEGPSEERRIMAILNHTSVAELHHLTGLPFYSAPRLVGRDFADSDLRTGHAGEAGEGHGAHSSGSGHGGGGRGRGSGSEGATGGVLVDKSGIDTDMHGHWTFDARSGGYGALISGCVLALLVLVCVVLCLAHGSALRDASDRREEVERECLRRTELGKSRYGRHLYRYAAAASTPGGEDGRSHGPPGTPLRHQREGGRTATFVEAASTGPSTHPGGSILCSLGSNTSSPPRGTLGSPGAMHPDPLRTDGAHATGEFGHEGGGSASQSAAEADALWAAGGSSQRAAALVALGKRARPPSPGAEATRPVETVWAGAGLGSEAGAPAAPRQHLEPRSTGWVVRVGGGGSGADCAGVPAQSSGVHGCSPAHAAPAGEGSRQAPTRMPARRMDRPDQDARTASAARAGQAFGGGRPWGSAQTRLPVLPARATPGPPLPWLSEEEEMEAARAAAWDDRARKRALVSRARGGGGACQGAGRPGDTLAVAPGPSPSPGGGPAGTAGLAAPAPAGDWQAALPSQHQDIGHGACAAASPGVHGATAGGGTAQAGTGPSTPARRPGLVGEGGRGGERWAGAAALPVIVSPRLSLDGARGRVACAPPRPRPAPPGASMAGAGGGGCPGPAGGGESPRSAALSPASSSSSLLVEKPVGAPAAAARSSAQRPTHRPPPVRPDLATVALEALEAQARLSEDAEDEWRADQGSGAAAAACEVERSHEGSSGRSSAAQPLQGGGCGRRAPRTPPTPGQGPTRHLALGKGRGGSAGPGDGQLPEDPGSCASSAAAATAAAAADVRVTSGGDARGAGLPTPAAADASPVPLRASPAPGAHAATQTTAMADTARGEAPPGSLFAPPEGAGTWGDLALPPAPQSPPPPQLLPGAIEVEVEWVQLGGPGTSWGEDGAAVLPARLSHVQLAVECASCVEARGPLLATSTAVAGAGAAGAGPKSVRPELVGGVRARWQPHGTLRFPSRAPLHSSAHGTTPAARLALR
eukprot:CAMPEP_0185168482 /NCGR_PEP_ID=MMETSP1139-20130426/15888_1 /TAXON_ID=298111 /ORGANISM="Pavlova sp., Strain CCMP459" /LENGTH=1140 /DNA_ID=CAMNT_0027733995 /DNA_START=67 /DNA_END=3485 /DNA_ORIENTATION=-